MVKKLKGGSSPQTEEKKESTGFFMTIINGLGFLIKIFIIGMILFASLSIVLMFVGSYILLGYFLQAVNMIFIDGINGIILIVVRLVKFFAGKKESQKLKKGKLNHIPTDPSQIVMNALGLSDIMKDDDEEDNVTEDTEEEYCKA